MNDLFEFTGAVLYAVISLVILPVMFLFTFFMLVWKAVNFIQQSDIQRFLHLNHSFSNVRKTLGHWRWKPFGIHHGA